MRSRCTQVFEWVLCSEPKLDSHRFRDIVLEAIEEGRAKPLPAFKPWSERVAAQPRPKSPFARPKKRKAPSGGQQLVAQIRCRQRHIGLPWSRGCFWCQHRHCWAYPICALLLNGCMGAGVDPADRMALA